VFTEGWSRRTGEEDEMDAMDAMSNTMFGITSA